MYTKENVEVLQNKLFLLCELLDEFGHEMQTSGRKLTTPQQYFNRYLSKTRIHLDSIGNLLIPYSEGTDFIVSIAQIMRALMADFLSAFYLWSFIDLREEGNVSFVNELHLMDRDAFRSVKEWAKVEADLHKFNDVFEAVSEEETKRKLDVVKSRFSYLFKEDGSLKKTFEIREGTKAEFFTTADINKPDGMLSESYKLSRLKTLPNFGMLDGYMLYKYYSQFYHESSLYEYMTGAETADVNFGYLKWGFNPVCFMLDTAIRLFMEGDSKYSGRILEIKNHIESIGYGDHLPL